MMMNQHSLLADRWRMFIPSFTAGDAPLYAHLATEAARASATDDEFWQAQEPFLDEPDRLLLPLRVLAAVHRWVLSDRLPDLAAYYPTMDGELPPDASTWPLFRDAVVRHADELHVELAGVNQHNEIGRAAALSVGFLDLAAGHPGMPHRYLEVGASAGLLLLWDLYMYYPWYREMFDDPAEAPMHAELPRIVERRGCDLNPIDPTTDEGALRLRSWVWADLGLHRRMLDAAIAIRKHTPAVVEQADGAVWLERELAGTRLGVLTVVYHSMMTAASEPGSLDRMAVALYEAADRATVEAPFAHVRFEVGAAQPHQPARCQVAVTTWPGGNERKLVTCDVNGRHTQWPVEE